MTDYTKLFGSIVLAAYRPNLILFKQQLRSIQNQTITGFECIISADGDMDAITRFVLELTNSDLRFKVVGFNDRRGFYHNFERGLAAVSARSEWVALCDQDDFWYPLKLESLLPELNTATAVTGQARVVEYPSGKIILNHTKRVSVNLSNEIVQNQFSGALSIFRKSVLSLALPFPKMSTAAQVHDHWMAVCAGALGQLHAVPCIVQDYVQHSENVIGEKPLTNPFNIFHSVKTLRDFTKKYEPNGGLISSLSVIYKAYAGWRELMVDTIKERVTIKNADIKRAILLFGSGRAPIRSYMGKIRIKRQCNLNSGFVLMYLASEIAGELLRLIFAFKNRFKKPRYDN